VVSYGFLFDNAEDTLSFKSFQTFNFHGWNDAPEVLNRCSFYVCIEHRMRSLTPKTSAPPSSPAR